MLSPSPRRDCCPCWFCWFCGAGGNDADAIVLEDAVHYEQQAAESIESDHRVARFVVARRVGQDEQRVGEHGGRVLEADAMLPPVGFGLVGIPDEIAAADVVPLVHAGGIVELSY